MSDFTPGDHGVPPNSLTLEHEWIWGPGAALREDTP